MILLDTDMNLCTACRWYRLGNCQNGKGVWGNYQVPAELRDRKVRCAVFEVRPDKSR